MKIITILGTRPEIIRLSRIMPKLDDLSEHKIIFTGQNFDYRLNDIFWNELNLRNPDYIIDSKSDSFSEQISKILIETEKILKQEMPDKVLLLGDTNSGLTSILCARLKIPVYHLEAGNRCGNKNMSEEINRHIIDSISKFNIPYTEKSKYNLLCMGIENNKIMVSGNPIYEVIKFYEKQIEKSNILEKLKIKKNDYFVSTFHRSETVDDNFKLEKIIFGLNRVAEQFNKKIICSIHPRTEARLKKNSFKINENIIFIEPVGFFDFIKLEKYSKLILTDSGTCSEEGAIFKVPVIIMRNETERPEIIENGLGIVSGVDSKNILNCSKIMMGRDYDNFKIPEGYLDLNVSDKIINYILGTI